MLDQLFAFFEQFEAVRKDSWRTIACSQGVACVLTFGFPNELEEASESNDFEMSKVPTFFEAPLICP